MFLKFRKKTCKSIGNILNKQYFLKLEKRSRFKLYLSYFTVLTVSGYLVDSIYKHKIQITI